MVNRQAAVLMMFSLLVVLTVLTVARNHLYRDALLLWEDVVAKSPAKRRPHQNYGHLLAVRQQYGKALEHLQTVLMLKEDDHITAPIALRELSFVYFSLGLYDHAIEAGRKGLEGAPGDAKLLGNVAAGYFKKQMYPLAIQYAQAAHRADPLLMPPLNILGESHLIRKEYERALYYFLLSIEREPDNAFRYWNAAAVYEAAGQRDLALRYYSLYLEREVDPAYRKKAEDQMRNLGRGKREKDAARNGR